MERWEAGMEGAEVARGRREWGTEVFGRETEVGDTGGWGRQGCRRHKRQRNRRWEQKKWKSVL